jgi:DNA polymerase-3 subunit epsilon
MVNRRGAIFNRTLFRYAEISDVGRAADDLLACGQARTLRAEDYASFVACLPKDVLVGGAKAAGRTDIRVSWPKARLVDYFLTHVPFEVAAKYCEAVKFIALDDVRPLEFLLYLYFGKTEDDLKNFALRDLGIMRTNRATSFKARFTDEEARACFHYSRLLDRIEIKTLDIYRAAVADIFGGPDCPSDYAVDLRSRVACQVGQFFEKLGERDLARQLYRAGSSPECRERLVRLLYGAGDKVDAEDLLRRMIDDPASDDEHVFATDFYARKFGGRRTGSCTELLRAGVTLTVDDAYRGNPEAGVASVMRRRGYRVFFAENTLWHSLFGLLFWDELFESDLLHSSFDWVPHCLNDRSFAHRFATTSTASWRPLYQEPRSICCCVRSLRSGASRTASSPGTTSMSTRYERCCRELAGKGSQPSYARCAKISVTCATGFRISCWKRTAPSPSWRSRPRAM